MARLGDVCAKITDGSHNPPQGISCSEYLMLSSKNIYDDDISFDDPRYLSKENYETENKRTQISAGDILLTIVGTVGRAAVVSKTEKKICLQRSVAVIKPKQELIDSRFLMYQLQSMRTHLEQEARGVAQKGIYLRQVENLQIKVPSRGEQLQVVSNLDQISELISLRKQQLAKLDELVKSRFIELFGDGNDERFPLKTLPQIVAKDRHALKRGPFGGALKKDDFVESGYLVYEQRHAIHNDFEYEKYYISPKKYQEMSMFKVSPGDLIISCSGVTLGRIAEIPVYAKAGIINQALLKVSLDQSIMLNTFFVHQFRSERIQDVLFGFCRGSGIPNFPSMSEVKSVKFICPPIALQEQFAAFVEQTDKSKLAIQESLAELETLKKALMQKYFG